jgi:adenine deaminase
VLLREGSVAKNLKQQVGILTAHSSPKVSLCTDDRNPVDILDEGHINYLIQMAIKAGVEPSVAYRSASWSTAVAYGLKGFGAIAPGQVADLVVLKDIRKAQVAWVVKAGKIIKSEKDVPKLKVPPLIENTVRYKLPKPEDFYIRGGEGLFRVIEVVPNQIITKTRQEWMTSKNDIVQNNLSKDILKISVLERHGRGNPLALGFVSGFGLKSGAIGSTVGHDSHNAVTVGTNDEDMLVAFEWLQKAGGGFCAVNKGKVIAGIELPIAGLMTDRPLKEVYKKMKTLRKATQGLGSKLHEPFLQLAFLCLPVIPELKITDLGLVDVNKFERVSLRI